MKPQMEPLGSLNPLMVKTPRKHDLNYLNQISLYPKLDENGFFEFDLTVRLGNCAYQRQQYPYVSRMIKDAPPKIVTRQILRKETKPQTLDNLRFNPKFNYSISFKCPICLNHTSKHIKKNHHTAHTRKTPICPKCLQAMAIMKVTKKPRKTPLTVKVQLPKIIYEIKTP